MSKEAKLYSVMGFVFVTAYFMMGLADRILTASVNAEFAKIRILYGKQENGRTEMEKRILSTGDNLCSIAGEVNEMFPRTFNVMYDKIPSAPGFVMESVQIHLTLKTPTPENCHGESLWALLTPEGLKAWRNNSAGGEYDAVLLNESVLRDQPGCDGLKWGARVKVTMRGKDKPEILLADGN